MASYNRYNASTGRFTRVETPEPQAAPPPSPPVPYRPGVPTRPVQRAPGAQGPLGMLGGIQDTLSGILPKVLPDGLETEDLLLLLILYLMYKESGDKELLIIMGAMFFL